MRGHNRRRTEKTWILDGRYGTNTFEDGSFEPESKQLLRWIPNLQGIEGKPIQTDTSSR